MSGNPNRTVVGATGSHSKTTDGLHRYIGNSNTISPKCHCFDKITFGSKATSDNQRHIFCVSREWNEKLEKTHEKVHKHKNELDEENLKNRKSEEIHDEIHGMTGTLKGLKETAKINKEEAVEDVVGVEGVEVVR